MTWQKGHLGAYIYILSVSTHPCSSCNPGEQRQKTTVVSAKKMGDYLFASMKSFQSQQRETPLAGLTLGNQLDLSDRCANQVLSTTRWVVHMGSLYCQKKAVEIGIRFFSVFVRNVLLLTISISSGLFLILILSYRELRTLYISWATSIS